MEENKEDIIYDMECPESGEGLPKPDESDNPGNPDNPETPENPDNLEIPDNPDNPTDPSMAEIERMVSEMGAETLLSIIKDNRNAAIRQIISEVEASRTESIPSGVSVAGKCSSIFDLAALA